MEDTIKHNRSLWGSLNQNPAFLWAKNIIVFVLLVFYLLPFLGTGEWINAGITRLVEKEGWDRGWAVVFVVGLYYAPFFLAPLAFRQDKEELKPKQKRSRAPTTRRRKGENDADYISRIIEKDCKDMTEAEVIAWIKEHRRAKR